MEGGTGQPDGSARPRPPARRYRVSGRRRLRGTLLRIAIVAAVFILGLVIGRAIEDAPEPGGEQTVVRTLQPSTLAPVETVTVTGGGTG